MGFFCNDCINVVGDIFYCTRKNILHNLFVITIHLIYLKSLNENLLNFCCQNDNIIT